MSVATFASALGVKGVELSYGKAYREDPQVARAREETVAGPR